MKLTTESGIICPNCHRELIIHTKGIFGGFIAHLILINSLQKIKKTGGKLICNHCQSEFLYHKKQIYKKSKYSIDSEKDMEQLIKDMKDSFGKDEYGKR